MSFNAGNRNIASETQPLNYISTPPDVCLIPAPPPPTGPQGIPTPFPIMTRSANVVKDPASKVEHGGKKVMNTKSECDGIKGNEAGVGRLPPGKPEKDILTQVNMGKANAFIGNFTVKIGGAPVAYVTSQGFGNLK